MGFSMFLRIHNNRIQMHGTRKVIHDVIEDHIVIHKYSLLFQRSLLCNVYNL